jgi:hypothetical protein
MVPLCTQPQSASSIKASAWATQHIFSLVAISIWSSPPLYVWCPALVSFPIDFSGASGLFDKQGQLLDPAAISTCGYSPIAIMITMLAGCCLVVFCCYAWFALLQSRHSTGWKLQHCHFRSLSWLECRHDSAIEMKRHVGKGG